MLTQADSPAVAVRRFASAATGTRVRAHGVTLALGAIVLVSASLRMIAALPRRTIAYVPDEYVYSSLARSLAAGGKPTVRGASAHFPALLEPIVAAPLWIVSDPRLSLRLTQGLHALLMSLAAIPVYLLARGAGLEKWQGLACAVLTLALPDLILSGYLTADALAFALALATLALAQRVLAAPTRLGQLGFLALAFLTIFARAQYVVLLPAFVCAAFAVAGRRAFRRFGLAAILIGLSALCVATLGAHEVLGYYDKVTSFDLRPGPMLRWAGADTLLLGFVAAGILPAAAVGLVFGFLRPRTPRERGFAAMILALSLGLLLEAALYATNGSPRFQERYLFVLLPCFAIASWLAPARGRRATAAAAGVAVAIAVFAARVPLSGYSAGLGSQDSPFLRGQLQLERALDGVSGASALVALAVTALALLGAWAVARRRLAAPLFAVAILFAGSYSILASANVAASSRRVLAAQPADLRWIDHAGLNPVELVLLPDGGARHAFQSLFWNRSLRDVYVLPGAARFDAFSTRPLRIGSGGRLVSDGRGFSRPFLLDEYGARAVVAGATLVRRAGSQSIWKPNGTPRFVMLSRGLYFDGWLGSRSSIVISPRQDRGRAVFVLRLTLPGSQTRPVSIDVSAPRYRRTVTVRPLGHGVVRVPFDGSRAVTIHLRASKPIALRDGRLVGAFVPTPPRIVRGGGRQAMTARSR